MLAVSLQSGVLPLMLVHVKDHLQCAATGRMYSDAAPVRCVRVAAYNATATCLLLPVTDSRDSTAGGHTSTAAVPAYLRLLQPSHADRSPVHGSA